MRLRIVAGCSLSLLLVDVVSITAQQQRPPLTCEQRQQRVKSTEEEITSLTARAVARKASCTSATAGDRAAACSAYGAALGLQREKEHQLETMTKDPEWQACRSVLEQARRPGDGGVSNYRTTSGQSGGSNTGSGGTGTGQGGAGTSSEMNTGQGGAGTSSGMGSGQGGAGTSSGMGTGQGGSGSVGRISDSSRIPPSGSPFNPPPGDGASGGGGRGRSGRTGSSRTGGSRIGNVGGGARMGGTRSGMTGGGQRIGSPRSGGTRTGGRQFGSHGRVGSLNRSGGHSFRPHGGGSRSFHHSGGRRGGGHRR
jgi:hypothetical protein